MNTDTRRSTQISKIQERRFARATNLAEHGGVESRAQDICIDRLLTGDVPVLSLEDQGDQYEFNERAPRFE